MKSKFLTRHPVALAVAVAVMLAFGSVESFANHDTLRVVINGKLLSPAEIEHVQRLIGAPLQSGNYWHDASSGYWGVVNGPVLGRVAPQGSSGPRGGGTTRNNPDGSWGYRNDTTGGGMIYDPNGGGDWRDRVWVSPR